MTGETAHVDIARRPLGDYEAAAGAEALERVRALAEPLAGARVLHLAAGSSAGRPATLLGSVLPLLRGVGIEVEWRVLSGGPAFESTARNLDNGLRGAETAISDEDWEAYTSTWRRVDVSGCDAVVAHDPAALGAVAARAQDGGPRWLWHCHVDASAPDAPAWERASVQAAAYDVHALPLRAFAPPGIDGAHELRPGIDPLAPRNRELPVKLAGDALRFLGIDLSRPFACQVGALDPWQDPHETIDAFRLAKRELPELQLVLAGDDEPDWRIAGEVADYAGEVEDLLVLSGYVGVGETELNAMQLLARAALHVSLHEGFGLGASEALWKGTPVVGIPRGGIPEQVHDGEHGFLAEGAEAIAARLVELVGDPALGIVLGQAGRARVRERFLITRLLEDELALLHATLAP
ncbi:MAG: glycosyltransferase [Thermoleophilaceae bacterium]